MRFSKYYTATTRETPSDAEIASHILSLRAGLIKKSASGIYFFLPLGLRVLKKIEKIVREEMNAAGAIEILMPVLQPAELWQKSGRWDNWGSDMMRLVDRNKREYCLGPTHEELITSTIAPDISSYKKLPINLYQIQVKFRDEVRPRFGLLRAREFIMKDGYSFARNKEEQDEIYTLMYAAYERIVERLGLQYVVVEADSGLIGGDISHEVVVLADSGESDIAICESCNFSANVDMMKLERKNTNLQGDQKTKIVDTPYIHTVEELSTFLKVPSSRIIKTIIVSDHDDNIYAALIRGDRDLSLSKLSKYLGRDVNFISSELAEKNGIFIGFVGPLGLKNVSKICADFELHGAKGMVTGANQKDKHALSVDIERDVRNILWTDITIPVDGDVCPTCKSRIKIQKGIEVGHIFQLDTKYSNLLNATYVDEDGEQKEFVMGCYGIGITRLLSAIIEQCHDESGIIWPISTAPIEVAVLCLNQSDAEMANAAEVAYQDLIDAGVDVIYDDRSERAGVKFNDADLIGFPLVIIAGKKFVDKGILELRIRKSGESFDIEAKDIVSETTRAIKRLWTEIK
jgi:prolyl-tRNA synthetase